MNRPPPTLFDRLSHKSDPDTSRAAAQKMVESGALLECQQKVWQLICEWTRTRESGFTGKDLASLDLAERMGLDFVDIDRRLGEINRIARVVDHYEGEKAIYKRRNKCCVWERLR